MLRLGNLTCLLFGLWASPGVLRAEGSPDELNRDELNRLGVLLSKRCLACHGEQKQEGNYSVASLDKLRTAGDSEQKPIVPGKPTASELFRRLVTTDESERMPAEADALSSAEIALVEKWIQAGARVPADLKAKQLVEWIVLPKSMAPPEHYPTPVPISAIAAPDDGQTVVVSGYGEVTTWDLQTGKLQQRREVAGTQVADVELSHDARYLAVSSGTPGTQGFVQVWQVDAPESSAPFWSLTSADVPSDIAFSPTQPRLAVGRSDGSLLVVDLRELKTGTQSGIQILNPHADAILAVHWSGSGERLMTSSRDRTAKIFDATDLSLIANYDRHERAVGGVAYLGDNPVSFDETGKLRLWAGDDNDRTVAERDNLPRFLQHILADESRLLLPDANNIRTYSIERKTVDDGKDADGKAKSKKVTRWIESQGYQVGSHGWILCMSQSDKLLVAGTESGEVIVWDKEEATPKFRFLAKP